MIGLSIRGDYRLGSTRAIRHNERLTRCLITTRYERIVEGPVFASLSLEIPKRANFGRGGVWYRFPFNQLLVSFPREIYVVCGQSGILMARPWPMISQDKGKRYLRRVAFLFTPLLHGTRADRCVRIGDKFWSNCTLCRAGLPIDRKTWKHFDVEIL